ncbi:MAG: glycosyltransferase family 9 protein, partial [Caulobacteraceae bacterium]
ADGHVQLGSILVALGRLSEAGPVYETALGIAPDGAEASFGRAFLRLLQGEYALGWQDYEFRPARRGPVPPALQPQWRGEDLAGKTLLIYAEQGFGDSIQFLRYAPALAARGARVLVALPVPLMGLAARVEGVAEVVEPTFRLPPFDLCIPLGSLPLCFATRLDDIPGAGGYLSAPPEQVARWKGRLGGGDKFTVAFAWAGNPGHPNDHNRSVPLAELSPLLRVRGVRWLSLQKGPVAADLGRYREIDLLDLGEELGDFSDTAAVLSCADLTISVDTALCHLGGALGRPTWTLTPFAPDWRWSTERRDTPWYAAMRLYRQRSLGDWSGAMAEAAGDLATMAAGARFRAAGAAA